MLIVAGSPSIPFSRIRFDPRNIAAAAKPAREERSLAAAIKTTAAEAATITTESSRSASSISSPNPRFSSAVRAG